MRSKPRFRVFKSLWGMPSWLEFRTAPPATRAVELNRERALAALFNKVRTAGYSGVEAALPIEHRRAAFGNLLRDEELDYIPIVQTQPPDHAASLERQILATLPFEPALVTCQGGRDSMTEAEGMDFLEHALRIANGHAIQIGHETHRGRILFAPWVARRYLEALPALSIVADYSHWVCVCERPLEDLAETLDAIHERAIHIHTRVGHPQGPQVVDPRLPDYAALVDIHEGWWEAILALRVARSLDGTATPEYGPAPYLPTVPRARRPPADIWELSLWTAERLRGIALTAGYSA